jgi:peptidoglycan/xylan/chitin deacetylase (PgdA/CDA1 family)
MYPAQLSKRMQGRYRRATSRLFFNRVLRMRNSFPLISFTFDDFPRSAFLTGGAVLRRSGVRGTYYASLGLIGQDTPSGTIFSSEDLGILVEDGHELGCHTFDHCHAWETSPAEFEESILKNRRALSALVPTAEFRTGSYPISDPRPSTKRRAAKYFNCWRGGGQTFNVGTVDLNNLRGFFLEQSSGDSLAIRNLIDRNCQARGWLIFATHDVCKKPTRFGCSTAFFEEVVRLARNSGATVLPVGEALELIRACAGSQSIR